MAYSSSDYTLFSSSSSLNPSPLITVPLADLFLGNPIRNRCLIPIPDMLEADDGASTSLTPRKRTNGTKRKTSQIVAGFYTSQDEVMDASVEDAMDSDHSEEDCDSDVEEMEVAGWMVLTPSKRPLRRPITPISSGSRPFIPTERRSDEESDDEQLAEEDINLERIKRNRIDKGKARAMDTDPPIHLNQLGASIGNSYSNGASKTSNDVPRPPSMQYISEQLGIMIADPTLSLDKTDDLDDARSAMCARTPTTNKFPNLDANIQFILAPQNFSPFRKRKRPCSPITNKPKLHFEHYHSDGTFILQVAHQKEV